MPKILDLTGNEPEIYEVHDCEYCGAEISYCDCDDTNQEEEE